MISCPQTGEARPRYWGTHPRSPGVSCTIVRKNIHRATARWPSMRGEIQCSEVDGIGWMLTAWISLAPIAMAIAVWAGPQIAIFLASS